MKKRIKNTWKMATEVAGAIKAWRNAPIHGIGLLLTTLALGISCIGFIVAYVIFIAQGGYGNQIEMIQMEGLGKVSKSFSNGTVSMLYQGMVGILPIFLLLISSICMMIYFFMNETIVKKMVAIIDMILTGLIAASPILLKSAEKLWTEEIISRFFQYYIIVVIVVFIITMISFIIVMLKSVCRLLFRYLCTVLILVYCVNPLVLYFLENIIATIVFIVMLAFMGLIICITMRVTIEGIFCSGDSGNMNSGSAPPPKKQETGKNDLQPKVRNFNGNVKFFRDKGGYGITTPSDDCIYFAGNMEKHSFVCTVEDYEKGKIIIMLNGKQVTNI